VARKPSLELMGAKKKFSLNFIYFLNSLVAL